MPFLVSLFLLAAIRNVTVLDQTFQVPADSWRYAESSEWRYPALEWKEGPAIVRAEYSVETGPPVRVMLMSRENLGRLKRGEAFRPPGRAPGQGNGVLQVRAGAPEDYVVVLDNRASKEPSSVHLHVSIATWNALQLAPGRRLAVLAISFGVFFGIVTYSASKLWRVLKR
jgi:hypothetical protein